MNAAEAMTADTMTIGRAERDREIVRRWMAGESQTAIGKAFGLTHSGVAKVLDRVSTRWAAARAGALAEMQRQRRPYADPKDRTGRSGRPEVWPDCPEALRPQYRKIRAVIGSEAAKAQLRALAAKTPPSDGSTC